MIDRFVKLAEQWEKNAREAKKNGDWATFHIHTAFAAQLREQIQLEKDSGEYKL